MGFLKNIEKAVKKHPGITGLLVSSPLAPPGLGAALEAERAQHEPHEKVKEIHNHYYNKKHK